LSPQSKRASRDGPLSENVYYVFPYPAPLHTWAPLHMRARLSAFSNHTSEPQEAKMLNGWLAWLIGVPSLIIILLWLVGSLR
jgi:hypothetical protein